MVLKRIDSQPGRTEGPRVLMVGMMVVIPLALFFLLSGSDDSSARTSFAEEPSLDSAMSAAAAMSEVSSYSLARFSTPGQAVNDTVIGDGLRLLSAALESVLGRNPEVGDRHANVPSELRASAARVIEATEPFGGERVARDAMRLATETVTALQQRNFPELAKAAEQLRTATAAIRDDRSFSSQIPELDSYFERASDILLAMIEMRP